jgi:hypothetical protein
MRWFSGVLGLVILLANGAHAQQLAAIPPIPRAGHPSSSMHVFGAVHWPAPLNRSQVDRANPAISNLD